MTDSRDSADNNGEVLEFISPPSIERQAHEWVVRLDDQPTAADRHGFKIWVNQSKAHRAAFEEMAGFWGEMDVLTQIVLPREQQSASAGRRYLFSSWGLGGHLAAAFSMVIAVALMFVPWGAGQQEYLTAIGEQKSIALSDGSKVLLNTNSQLRVDYNEERRKLTLLRGEAHFDVFHNAQVPFEVYAGEGLVRAVGTAFSVRLKARDVGVIVTEGKVEIDRAGAPTPATAQTPATGRQVEAGNQLIYDRQSIVTLEVAMLDDADEQLSWHEGNLVFDGETLEQVVQELKRYTPLQIRIPHKKTRQIKVGGVFKIGDLESFFEALERGFNIEVKEVVPGKVVHLLYKEKS